MLIPKGQYKQRGLAAIEFAITLPLIVLIALAVTELGRGMYQYNTLSKAVHDGARFLSDRAVNTVGDIEIDTGLELATKRVVVYGTIDPSGDPILHNPDDPFTVDKVDVTSDLIPLSDLGSDHNHVIVTARYTFKPLFPALSALGYSLIPEISVTAVERALKL